MSYKKYFHFPISSVRYSITKIRCKFLVLILIFMCSCTSKSQLDLNDEVEVLRDKYGINHIYAKNQQDLFFMQGYFFLKTDFFNLKFGGDRPQEPLRKFLENLN